ncbi:MAG: lysophospholipid acyltransferase family protein [Alphaproteobacteria bacterium]
MKKIRYICETLALHLLFFIFKSMPMRIASNTGGTIGRFIGPKLGANKKVRRHILKALNTNPQQADRIAQGMWENLGRVIAEYPHLEEISKNHTTFENEERLLSLIGKNEPQAAIFIGGHFANWEVCSAALLTQHNRKTDITYRAPNNPWVAKLLDKSRTLNHRLDSFPKSAESGRKIMQALKNKHTLGILIDQKYNEGIEIPFFERPAMTNPVAVQLAQRYRCPLVPLRIIRENNSCTFRIIIEPPLETIDENDNPRPVAHVLQDAHKLLESWITEKPEQWLWLHRRWKN